MFGRRIWCGGTAALVGLGAAVARAESPREKKARARAVPRLEALFADAGLPYPCPSVFLRALKHDAELQMWAAADRRDALVLVQTYRICAASGTLGPKRRQGDEQVPEGCYAIDLYNPWSAFHLSMRVDYPNASDRIRGTRGNLGGAIMVHGGCATIGCIPIQDDPIEEVFVACRDAHRTGRREVPIHILPTSLDEDGMELLRVHPDATASRLALWEELRPIYAAFEDTAEVPEITIDRKTGAYRLS